MSLYQHGLERYAADLPDAGTLVTLGEGGTPVLDLHDTARQAGLGGLSAKMESANPTGSYKDRVAAMSMSLARHRGYAGWIATSSGNAGMSLAAYGARAALRGFLCLVSTAPAEKRLPLMPYGVELVAVRGTGDGATTAGAELMAQVRAAAERHKLYLGITANAFNPDGMRGIDTIGYELAEQLPDATHVYVPVGGGGLLTSLARGLAARAHPAKVVACQPTGCAPVVQFLDGEIGAPEVGRCDTMISALQLPYPPDGPAAAAAVRASGGWGTHVSDDEILMAQRRLAATEGVFVEPAAAAPLAAVLADAGRGRLGASDHPVLICTGAGWKDLGRFSEDARRRAPTVGVVDVAARVAAWAGQS
ncbi:pyridoxal-phosphate dependent enzyme [Phytoactinopolyspora mesophila]|uniref:Pyridoxal-phosphate dependent enzyme n=1 Tax=Phytoactinopolyspora mesophila TaxID=2650750 RepID=A0A7K3LYA2_9ACTN|nr:pyridoxal-phosphate dependent enzyme [Phytoactinopolyspora mesophila]NDL55994.1 pyridoxal-phosphate dependent enzyme [Phytoactinopolyspora mesophila]